MVVEQGDDVGDLGRRGAVGQHAFYQLADFAAQVDQGLQPWRMADGAGQVHQIDPLQREQVALGDHAAQALFLDQTHVGDVPFGHGNGGVEGTVIG